MEYRKRLYLFFFVVLIIAFLVCNTLLFVGIDGRETDIKKQWVQVQVRQMRLTVDYLIGKLRTDLTSLADRPEFQDLRQWYETTDYRAKASFLLGLAPLSVFDEAYDEAVIFDPGSDIFLDLKNKLVTGIAGSRLREKLDTVAAFMAAHPQNPEMLASLTIDGKTATYLTRRLDITGHRPGLLMMMQLNDNFFRFVVNDIFGTDTAFVLILNQDGTPIHRRVGDRFPADADATQLKPPFTDSGWLVASDQSPDNGWQYVYGLDRGMVRAEIIGVLLRFSLLALAVLLVTLAVAARLARKLYEPVGALLESLGAGGDESRTDEFALIQQNIRSLVERNRDLQQSLEENHYQERQTVLRHLTGPEAHEMANPAEEIARRGLDILCGSQVSYRVYACLANATTGLEGEGQLRLSPGSHGIWFLAHGGIPACIESMPGPQPQDIAACVRRGPVGVSAVHGSLSGLPDALREALVALDYRSMFSDERPIEFTELAMRSRTVHFYPHDLEKRLLSMVRQLDAPQAHACLLQFVRSVRVSEIAFENLKHFHFHLLDSLMGILQDFDLNLAPADAAAMGACWEQVGAARTPEELHGAMAAVLDLIIACLRSSKESPAAIIANEARQFIDANFSDRNLSMDMLSARLKYSVSHISTVFRDCFGETIKNYITGLRLDRAKALLSDSNQRIQDIASAVGYENVGSFVKIFKAYIGETPKEYRLRILKK